MPGARFFPAARLNYAENLLRRDDKAPALIFARRERRAARAVVRRAARAGRRARRVAARGRRARGRSGRGHPAQLPRGHRRDAGGDLARRGLVLVLARLRRARRARPLRPDRAQGALRRRRLLVRRQGPLARGAGGGDPRRPADRRARGRDPLPGAARRSTARATSRGSPRAADPRRASSGCPSPIRSSSCSRRGRPACPRASCTRAGGVLMKIAVEQRLHTDLRRSDRLFYFTTCGWMMWNWLATGLASGAALVLFDGSPFQPSERALFDLAERERVTVFGTSAKYLDAIRKSGLEPREDARPLRRTHDPVDRLGARARELRLRVRGHQARRAALRRSRAAPTSPAASPRETRCCRCIAARRSAWRSA